MQTVIEIENTIKELKAQITELEQKKTELLSCTYKYKKDFYVPFHIWDNMEFPETVKVVVHSYDENYEVDATVYYNERNFISKKVRKLKCYLLHPRLKKSNRK